MFKSSTNKNWTIGHHLLLNQARSLFNSAPQARSILPSQPIGPRRNIHTFTMYVHSIRYLVSSRHCLDFARSYSVKHFTCVCACVRVAYFLAGDSFVHWLFGVRKIRKLPPVAS